MKDRVLVVDDSRAINKMLCARLESLGNLTAESAGTLGETRALLAENPGRFMLAVLDLNLPDAPNGEAVELVRDFDIPAVVLTGSLDPELRRRMLDQRVLDYEVKSGSGGVSRIVDLVGRIRHFRQSTIMVVDDSRSTRRMVAGLLRRRCYHVIEAESGADALVQLDQRSDVVMVVTDFHMPEMNGDELTAEIRQRYARDEVAIIGLSSGTRGELTIPLLKNGANDFLSKPFEIEEFDARVDLNLDMLRYVDEARESANRDFLTHLHNRRYFFTMAEAAFTKAQQGRLKIAAVMCDIDHFKSVNDRYGHDAGDRVLVQVAGAMADVVRGDDLLARFGGEEFACLLMVESDDQVAAASERFRQSVEGLEIACDGVRVPVTVSIGVTLELGASVDDMLKRADQALYQAKQSGRNQVCVI